MTLLATQTISTHGRFTIPAKIRKALGLSAGTEVVMTFDIATKTITIAQASKY